MIVDRIERPDERPGLIATPCDDFVDLGPDAPYPTVETLGGNDTIRARDLRTGIDAGDGADPVETTRTDGRVELGGGDDHLTVEDGILLAGRGVVAIAGGEADAVTVLRGEVAFIGEGGDDLVDVAGGEVTVEGGGALTPRSCAAASSRST